MHKHMVFPIFILYFKKIAYQKCHSNYSFTLQNLGCYTYRIGVNVPAGKHKIYLQ
jgi:hypothetical protein